MAFFRDSENNVVGLMSEVRAPGAATVLNTPDSVVRTWFEELWNQGREETMHRLFAADGLAHGLAPDGAPMRGPEAFKPFYTRFREAFPDIHIEVLRTITEGEFVTAHCHVTATHTGKSLGPPTRKPIDFYGMAIVRVRDGKVIEAWNNFDFLSFYQQINLLPQLPT
jgi:steroid delta-isomerase-like uncharacterized protein